MAEMMTALQEVAAAHGPAVIDRGLALSTAQVIERTKKIREVMEAVMKKDVHYGVIPGTAKPTIYQPGADVLNVTFRIAPTVARVEDLSTGDEVRYRVVVRGTHQVSGELIAEGIGECSSNEEKYRWRRAVCEEEWQETPTDQRREKWTKGSGKLYKVKQVRTSPADVANTVLKMAVKRAKIAMTLNATAASDVFAQDLEDLSDELREHLVDEGAAAPAPVQPAQRKSQQASSSPASAPASAPESVPPPAPAPIGVIVAITEKHGGALIRLDTGYVCATRHSELMRAAAAHRDAQRRVELVTHPSSDPARYAPILDEILPAPEAR